MLNWKILATITAVGLLGFSFTFMILNSKDKGGSSVTHYDKCIMPNGTVILKSEVKTAEPQHTKTGTTVEKRVVSFGLYGTDSRYLTGALRNTELVKYILPGWVCRFYVDDSVPQETLKELKEEGAEIVFVSNIKGGIAGMFWRFLIADDETVDRYVVRDSDSRLSMRETMAIKEWIDSGKEFHVIRDHPNHNYNMNGGLWGGTKGALGTKISTLIDQWNRKDAYLADMEFLGGVIWPRIADKQIAHDAYHCERYPNSRPFPTRRVNGEIVGGVYNDKDEPREGDKNALREAPEKCRKKITWKYG
jgi:hypothetical protein